MIRKRNILEELICGSLSQLEAEAFYDDVMDSPNAANAQQMLELSNLEWTALCQGLPLTELAFWRAHGWPTSCRICGADLEISKYGWLVIGAKDSFSLKHVTCPSGGI